VVRLGRDDRGDAFGVELGAEGIAVIGLVHSRAPIDGIDSTVPTGASPTCPVVTRIATASASEAHKVWIFVVNPPRE
jgi:hypothetical protein